MREISKEEARKLWVSALRSGDFNQCEGVLQSGNSYCCLGVACVVAEKNGVSINRKGGSINRKGGSIKGGHLGIQPDVQKWMGLKDDCGGHQGGYLSGINDEGATFAEIADLIESNPKGLFTCEAAK
jgi:hypothetical protein